MRPIGNAQRLMLVAGGIVTLALATALYPALTAPQQPQQQPTATPAITIVPPALGPTSALPGPATPTVPWIATPGPFVPAMPTRLPVPPQPVAFPHVTMVARGIPCLFCHPDAQRSPAAGIPSVYKCMGCHDVIARDSPIIAQVRVYWEQQQSIPWVRLYRLPEFVQFSHQPHVNSGINCEECHGDVGHMAVTVTNPYYRQMGWCLECHEHRTDNPLPLTECQICHY